MSSDTALRQSQWDALWSLLRSCPGYRRCMVLQRDWLAYEKAGKAAKQAAGRRRERAGRDYLPVHVLIPVGSPAPETMRIRQHGAQRNATNPYAPRWDAKAPATGCREVRNAQGTAAKRSGAPAWGGPPGPVPAKRGVKLAATLKD